MRVWVAAAAAVVLGAVAHACVFDLADVVVPAGGMGGASGQGGNGDGGSAGEGGAPPWKMRVEVPGDATSVAQSDVVIPIVLDPGRFEYASAAANGSDVAVTTADGTPLPHEIERWDPGATSVLWTKLPAIEPGTGAVFYLRWGGAAATPTPAAVWADYAAVYHLTDPPDAGVARDATGSARDGDTAGMVAEQRVEGRLGFGYAFDGAPMGARVVVAGDPALSVRAGQALSVELWFQRAAGASWGNPLLTNEACCVGYDITEAFPVARLRAWIGVGCCVMSCCGGSAPDYHFPDVFLPGGDTDTSWHYLVSAMDRAGGSIAVYLDGALAGSVAVPDTTAVVDGDLFIGGGLAGMAGAYHGVLDEVRVSGRLLDAESIALQYAAMSDALLLFGAAEPDL
jgi:hypothetical protein